MARRFNKTQKALLFDMANGRDVTTGLPLEKGWHADHVKPWVNGGRTEIENGMAMSAQQNLKKGAREFIPRKWQREAFEKVFTVYENGERHVLVCATMGAGKTLFGSYVTHEAFRTGIAKRVIIVSPSASLRDGWHKDMHSGFGIQVSPAYSAHNPWPAGFAGISITYKTAARYANNIRRHAEGAIVIFDEVHHMSDSNSWGAECLHAFGDAAMVLSLTATPWRHSVGAKIPFLRYAEDDGELKVVADYTYSYREALSEPVASRAVVPVRFHMMDGEVRWRDHEGLELAVTFGDEVELDEKHERQRLNAALAPETEAVANTISRAHQRLTERRRFEPRDGGLIVCRTHNDAKRLAAVVKRLTGVDPEIVTSKEDEPHKRIDLFRKGSKEWVIAVGMISEGVDIKRLGVLAYLTNVKTSLRFRQIVGRVLRAFGKKRDADVFLMNDPVLLGHAKTLYDEMPNDALNTVPEEREDPATEAKDGGELTESQFRVHGAEADVDLILEQFDQVTPGQIEFVRQQCVARGMPGDPYQIASLILDLTGELPSVEVPAAPIAEESDHEKCERLKGQVSKLVRTVAAVTDRQFSHLHKELNRACGIETTRTASVRQLERKLELSQEMLANA